MQSNIILNRRIIENKKRRILEGLHQTMTAGYMVGPDRIGLSHKPMHSTGGGLSLV